jgi:hypothetical protein
MARGASLNVAARRVNGVLGAASRYRAARRGGMTHGALAWREHRVAQALRR